MTTPFVRVSVAVAAVVLLSACDKPTKDKPTATVAEPVAAASASSTGAGALYRITPADSKLGFVGAKVTGSHEGKFNAFDGTIRLVDGDPTKSAVTVDIDMPSVTVEPAKLNEHLKSADFFDVAKFPKARFVSTSIKAGGERGATHIVTGNLELHGVTKAITFPATIRIEPDRVSVDAEFGINRKDFGIVYPGKPDDLIRDDVLMLVHLKASKAAG